MDGLYRERDNIEDQFMDLYPDDFWDRNDLKEIHDALMLIQELHDSDTRDYLSRNKEELLPYIRKLRD